MNEHYDRTLFSLLHNVARLIRVEADKRARVHGMTRAAWSLMANLAYNPGMSQKELADLLDLEPISVARMVDRLEANGMLERRADASDRRIWRLHLLPASEPILKKMDEMAKALGDFVTQGVTPSVRDAMVEGLTQMKLNLTQKPEPQAPNGTAEDGSVREVA
jgi:MarR family transcriptional regulator, transcriptional regulator for hemolysin